MNALIEEIQETPSKATIALEKAKKLESKRIKKGYKYIRVTPNSMILVECDKQGNPTKKGLEHIEEHKKRFGFVLK